MGGKMVEKAEILITDWAPKRQKKTWHILNPAPGLPESSCVEL
jgi:hypothetical protein